MLPPTFLEDLRKRTPLQPLIARRVQLARAGREAKGCCPFHDEKTPSFYVYADHYHCFGCGAHGDCFTWIQQTEGLPFLDAVERLAREAGLSVPSDPATAEARARHAERGRHLDRAAAHFRAGLRSSDGAAARAYLVKRGVTDASIERFGLGWSGKSGLAAAIDAPIAALVEVGLMTWREEDGVAIDFFRDRLMFPIRGQAGAVVSFGGRTLGNAQPKYINGPETAHFAKRRTLYGLDLARAALADGAELIVVEGYLDVIALHQAGQGAAVAPLGSALTEEHIEELWRLSPAPLLCFDGDAAGQRACLRAIETALPQIGPGRTLRVVALPPEADPASLAQTDPEQLGRVLAAPRELSQVLPEMLKPPDPMGPFSQAVWRNRLELAAEAIHDRRVQRDVRSAMLRSYFSA